MPLAHCPALCRILCSLTSLIVYPVYWFSVKWKKRVERNTRPSFPPPSRPGVFFLSIQTGAVLTLCKPRSCRTISSPFPRSTRSGAGCWWRLTQSDRTAPPSLYTFPPRLAGSARDSALRPFPEFSRSSGFSALLLPGHPRGKRTREWWPSDSPRRPSPRGARTGHR